MAITYLTGGVGAITKNILRFVADMPLDGRVVVDTYSDISGDNYKSLFSNVVDGKTLPSYYTGMLVVTKDTGKLYVLASDGLFKEVTPDLSNIYGSITAENYTAAKALATSDNVGQIIYVLNEETSTTEKDENGEFIVYSAGPYVVAGANAISKLGTTSASGDLAGDVEALKGNVSTLQSDVKDLTPIEVTIPDESIQTLLGIGDEGGFTGGEVEVSSTTFASNNLNMSYTDFYELVEDKKRLVFITPSQYQINFTGYTPGGGTGKNLYGLLTFNVDASTYTVLVTCRLQADKLTLVGQPIGTAYGLATKTELTATKTELTDLITALPTFDIEIYEPTEEAPFPADPQPAILYLIREEEEGDDIYREWIYINNAWEKLGVHSLDVNAISEALDTKVDKAEGKELIDSTLIPVISNNKARIDVLEPIVGTETLTEKLPWQSEGEEYVAPTLVEAVEILADSYVTLKDSMLSSVASNNDSYLTVSDDDALLEGIKGVALTPVICTLVEASDTKTGLVDAYDAKQYIDDSISTALTWNDVE